MPTVTGSPTRSRTSRRKRTAISLGVPESRRSPRTSRNASSIDSPSTSGVVVEHPIELRARLDVRGHAWRDHDCRRAQATGHRQAHRAADAIRLRLVARSEHDSCADEHRAAAQPRIISLLDRREERVDVGMQDRRLAAHERMFAQRGATAREPS